MIKLFPTFLLALVLLVISCKKTTKPLVPQSKKQEQALFTLLPPDSTNIDFINVLNENLNANVLVYEYLYNGGGVAIADFNGDTLDDIYFSSNMGNNAFYINLGNLKFMEASAISHVEGRKGPWKTGVTAADVNGDGKLDIYLCYSGALPPEKRKNQLFINIGNNENGIPLFEEKSSEYGLDSPAFSNQGYFFDFDKDGDLDMVLLNHNPKSLPVLNENSTKEFLKKDDELQGIRLLAQNNGMFKDITLKAGISSSPLTYGLGLAISDVNNDGWMDFYVSNDYTIPDYLYINNKDGTFTNSLDKSMGHTSHFSMGNNIADINNDGLQDIFTLDMLPEDNTRQKLLLSPDNYEKFDLNLRSGFHYQYMRNMLQLNNGNGTFSEVGQQMNISNTDWSWAPLFADFDNDGYKDLFVTNGYFRDYTNLDFINYMDTFVQSKGRLKREDVLQLIEKMPSSNLTNYLFANEKGHTFQNKTVAWGMNQQANSNGAAYSDFDNDGDLDVVVNNINQPAFVYRNESSKNLPHNYLNVRLKGIGGNTQGIGAKVVVFTQNQQQVSIQSPAQGYLSSVTPILHFGLKEKLEIDSVKVVWNSGKQQILPYVKANTTLTLDEKNAVETTLNANPVGHMVFNTVNTPLTYTSIKAPFNDFKRQPLLIQQLSHKSPVMVKADINNDGLEDVVIGGGFNQQTTLFVQNSSGKFLRSPVPIFEQHKAYIDTDIAIFDANGDGSPDVYIGSGGYHNLAENDPLLQDRLYLGDSKGNFHFMANALPKAFSVSNTVEAGDVNGDGLQDIFVGGGYIPGKFPESFNNRLLINNGDGTFKNKMEVFDSPLAKGIITDAKIIDIDQDGHNDLITVGEWMPITIFLSNNGKLIDKTDLFFNARYSGWWNTINISDVNHDSMPDIIVGNMGNNTQFKITKEENAELIFDDFDDNGSIDPIFSFYIQGKKYPYVTRDELLGQLSYLRQKFTDYEGYSKATLTDIFTADQLDKSHKLTANHMETSLFLNNGAKKFLSKTLPKEAQYAPVGQILTCDFNKDGNLDLLLLGNNDSFKLRIGKFDANYGTLLKGDGAGNFTYVPQNVSGLNIKGSDPHGLLIDNILLINCYGAPVTAYKLNY